MEIIAVSIDGRDGASYQGLVVTFAGFIDSCLRKKMLPGFYQADLLGGGDLMKLNAAGILVFGSIAGTIKGSLDYYRRTDYPNFPWKIPVQSTRGDVVINAMNGMVPRKQIAIYRGEKVYRYAFFRIPVHDVRQINEFIVLGIGHPDMQKMRGRRPCKIDFSP